MSPSKFQPRPDGMVVPNYGTVMESYARAQEAAKRQPAVAA